MADELLNQSLEIFIQNYIDDLASGSLTPEEAYVAMRQYAPLRHVLDQKKEELTQKIARGEDIKELLVNILKLEIPSAGKEPNPLDEAKSPAEIAARAQTFTKAQQQIPQAAQKRFKLEQKNYARRVAGAWVAELRNRRLYNVTPEEEQIVTRSVENLPPTTSAAETKNLVTAQLQNLAQTNPNLSRGKEVLVQIAQATELADPTQIQQQMTKVVIDNPELTKPDVLIGLIAQGVDASRATSLARVAEALSLDINPSIDVTRPSVFFQAVATTGFQKLVAPAADAFLTVLPQKTREQIVESVLTKSWERVTQNLDQKFGTAVVSSPVFQEALTHGNRAFARPTAPGGAAAGLSKFFGDAFNTVFGSGVDQIMNDKCLELGKRTNFPVGRIAKYVPITSQHFISINHPTFLHFYTAFAHSHNPSLVSFTFEGGKWAMGKIGGAAAKKVVGAAARGIAAKIGIGAAIGSLIPIPVVGPVIGAIVSFVGGKLIMPLLRGAGSLIKNVFLGGFITRLFSGEPGRWQDDFPLVAAVIVLLPIILLFLLPSFLNPQFIGTTSQSSALVDMGTGGAAGIGAPPPCDPRTNPNCAVSFCNPAKQDCRWPTQSGCVTQGPNNGVGTHARLNAIDIGFRGATRVPIFATHDGAVVVTQAGFGINQFKQNSYGNYIQIKGKDANGKSFYTLYGHLATALVSQGQTVSMGQQIGISDNNGTSYGEHVHYEYRGGGDISEILPQPVPRCRYGACPQICW